MRKVIFDVDTGSDDAVELIYALKNNNIEVLGITTVFGSSPVEETTKHTLQVLDLIDKDIPVYNGCHKSLVSDIYDNGNPVGVNISMTVDAQGKKIGFHEVFSDDIPVRKAEDKHAVTFITETLKNSDEKITIVASGALTNLAICFRVAPLIKDKIDELIIMGGGVYTSNKTASAEGNFFRDPEAAKIVLQSGVKITLLPLDVTNTTALTLDDLSHFESLKTKVGSFIAEVINMRIKAYNILQPQDKKDIAIVHDLLCSFILQNPEIIEDCICKPATVCISHNEACGKLLVDNRAFASSNNIRIVMKVNLDKYKELLYQL